VILFHLCALRTLHVHAWHAPVLLLPRLFFRQDFSGLKTASASGFRSAAAAAAMKRHSRSMIQAISAQESLISVSQAGILFSTP